MFINILIALNYILAIVFRIGAALGMGIVSLVLLILAIIGETEWSTLVIVFVSGFAALILSLIFMVIGSLLEGKKI